MSYILLEYTDIFQNLSNNCTVFCMRVSVSNSFDARAADGKPRSHKDIVRETGLGYGAVGTALYRLWKAGGVL